MSDPWTPEPGVEYSGFFKDLNGQQVGIPLAEWQALHPSLVDRAANASDAADAKRDSLIDGGFVFMGHNFQTRPSDRENIAGAAQAAGFAIAQGGGAAGNLRWADPNNDFVWITADNTLMPMDALTVVGLFTSGVAFKSGLTFYARNVKNVALAGAANNDVTRVAQAEALLAADWRAALGLV